MDAERQQWLETLAAACERVLAGDAGDATDPHSAALYENVAELLARIRIELDPALGTPS